MNNQILFKESQRFKQWWLWLILFSIHGIFLYGIYQQIILEQPFGDRPLSNTGLLIAESIFVLFTLAFYGFHLETLIKDDGIYVRFLPFHRSFNYYSWDKIEKVYIRKYSPLKEFGGWGLRFGLKGNGEALNISGNRGLQIVFKNKRKLLIGTNKVVELEEALRLIASKCIYCAAE
jgi:hypothetical protein